MRWTVPPSAPSASALEALRERYPALADPAATPLAERFYRGEIVAVDGRAWSAQDRVGPGDQLWFHRELRPEAVDPAPLPILHRDDRLLVLDKPHDMATMPRGSHVLSSALVRLRRATGITTLSPLHRLDRRTAGVLVFGLRSEDRAGYQQLFAGGRVDKEYLARVAPAGGRHPAAGEAGLDGANLPVRPGARTTLRDRLHKRRGELTTRIVDGPPNALTDLEVLAEEADGTLLLRLRPRTGRTHQLRAQLAGRGAPIVGEDLYPRPLPAEQVVGPLQLLARTLSFTDPFTGQRQRFVTARALAGPPVADAPPSPEDQAGSRTLGR